TGIVEKGDWGTNVSVVTEYTKHPIPMYSHHYSSEVDGVVRVNEETYRVMRHDHNILDNMQAGVDMDRDDDNIDKVKQILAQGEYFVIRIKKHRHMLYQNKK